MSGPLKVSPAIFQILWIFLDFQDLRNFGVPGDFQNFWDFWGCLGTGRLGVQNVTEEEEEEEYGFLGVRMDAGINYCERRA